MSQIELAIKMPSGLPHAAASVARRRIVADETPAMKPAASLLTASPVEHASTQSFDGGS
ncbi:hypothetical protein [Bradyrhizobium cenepequi]